MATGRLAQTLSDLDPYLDDWDRLAVSAARPLMRPALLLAWWRANCQSGVRAELRIALALDDRGLAGVLPLYVDDPETRIPVHEFLGAGGFWGQGPPLRGDASPETLRLLTEVMAASSPAPVVLRLQAVDVAEGWPHQVAALWPTRGAWLHTRAPVPSRTVTLRGDFDDWLRSAHRWTEHWRMLRRLAEREVILRKSTTATEFRKDLAALTRLHHVGLGDDSAWLSPAMETALDTAGSQLIDSGGLRLWVLEGEQGVVGATLFLCAGLESCCLLTAYDHAWRPYGPGIATIIAGIQDAFLHAEQVVDLGHGRFEYKRRLANSERPVAWLDMLPRGRTYPLARACWAPRHARERLNGMRVRFAPRQRLSAVRGRARAVRSRSS